MEFCSHLNGILFSPQWNFVLTSMEFCSHLNGILFSPQWNFVLTLKSENTHKHWLF
jgi:hypothetical protein